MKVLTVKKLLLFLTLITGFSSSLFAGFTAKSIETALTMGNNVFDQPSCLLAHKRIYGIRAGIYNNTGLGLLLGYERANDVNCPECPNSDIQRFSGSIVQEMLSPVKLVPYAMATVGYEESSNEKTSPDQFFAGLGAGIKYRFTENFNAFADLRALRKFDSDTTDIVTTFGIAYLFQPYQATTVAEENTTLSQPPVVELDIASGAAVAPQTDVTEVITPQALEAPIEVTSVSSQSGSGKYYVQAGAYASGYPADLLRKLKKAGIRAKTKKVTRNGKKMTLVVTGPYKSKAAAKRALRKVKKTVSGAFITKL